MANLQATTVTGTITSTTGFSGASSLSSVGISQFTTGNFPAAYLPAGCVVGTSHYSNSTRTVTSSAATYTIFSFSITKKLSTSLLVVEGVVPIWGNGDAAGCCGISIGGSWNYTGMQYRTNWTGLYADASHGAAHINQVRSGIGAGTQTVILGWNSSNGSAYRPWQIINPNNSDNAVNRQTGTQLHIWEIAQ